MGETSEENEDDVHRTLTVCQLSAVLVNQSLRVKALDLEI
jgi:hypothetical protein